MASSAATRSRRTQEDLLEYVRLANRPLTATELAGLAHCSETTVRRQMKRLVARGKVEEGAEDYSVRCFGSTMIKSLKVWKMKW